MRSAWVWASPPRLCCSVSTQTCSAIRHWSISSRSYLAALVRSSCAWGMSFVFTRLHVCLDWPNCSHFCSTCSQQSLHRPSFDQQGLAGHPATCRFCHGGTSLLQSKAHISSSTKEEAKQLEEEAQKEASTSRKAESSRVGGFAGFRLDRFWLLWHHLWEHRATQQKQPCSKSVFLQERYECLKSFLFSYKNEKNLSSSFDTFLACISLFTMADKYYRVDLHTKRVDSVSPPYPRSIAKYWLGCKYEERPNTSRAEKR